MQRICFWEPFSFGEEMEEDDVEMIDEDYPKVKIFQGMLTPAGLFPLVGRDSFNVFVLHTNFKVTKADIKKVAEINGVEHIRPFSRYRIQIAFGKLFDDEVARSEIEETLGAEINFSKDIELTPELQSKIDMVREEVSKNKHWLIYVGANGEIKSYYSNEISHELKEKVMLFDKLHEAVGGYLLCSSNIF